MYSILCIHCIRTVVMYPTEQVDIVYTTPYEVTRVARTGC